MRGKLLCDHDQLLCKVKIGMCDCLRSIDMYCYGLIDLKMIPHVNLYLLVLHKILEEVRKNGERMSDLKERVKKVETEESSSKPAPRKKKSANPSPQLRVSLV